MHASMAGQKYNLSFSLSLPRMHTILNTRDHTRTAQCKDINTLQLQSDQPWEALVLSPLLVLKNNLNTRITHTIQLFWMINTQTIWIACFKILSKKDKHSNNIFGVLVFNCFAAPSEVTFVQVLKEIHWLKGNCTAYLSWSKLDNTLDKFCRYR